MTDKTISINKTVQRIYDKKKGESYLHIGPPKTKTSARTIPVPSLLMNIIKKFYTENPNHYFLTGKTKPTEPRTYRQFFSRFLKRNGLQKVKFHEIRHTFAVRAIEIPEFDVKSLSEILGHKKEYPFPKMPCILLVGKYPKPSDFPLTTYNTAQGDFAEVLRENFQKVFLISYYRKVSEMPNK